MGDMRKGSALRKKSTPTYFISCEFRTDYEPLSWYQMITELGDNEISYGYLIWLLKRSIIDDRTDLEWEYLEVKIVSINRI